MVVTLQSSLHCVHLFRGGGGGPWMRTIDEDEQINRPRHVVISYELRSEAASAAAVETYNTVLRGAQ